MEISIILPTYNNLVELIRCLESLAVQSFRNFEVVVSVDGSTDGTVIFMDNIHGRFPFPIKKYISQENVSRAHARNRAIGLSEGRYILFLDSDIFLDKEALSKHHKIVSGGGNVVSLGDVFYINRKKIWSYYINTRGVKKYRDQETVLWNYFTTQNSCLPADWVKALNGFDENISRYGGVDMELAYRIKKEYDPFFVYNQRARGFCIEDKPLSSALNQLYTYGRTGLRYINRLYPELNYIYYVKKVNSVRWSDRLFMSLLNPAFQWVAQQMVHFSFGSLRNFWINYLVICHILKGYKEAESSGAPGA